MTYLAKPILILTFVLLLTACGADTIEPTFQVESPTDPSQQSQLAVALPLLLKACPGLNRYAADLSPAKVSDTSMRNYEGGIDIAFKVADRPTILPSPLNTYSMGNNCSIIIKQDGSMAYIPKRACHSICDGTWHENDSNSLGRELQLTKVALSEDIPSASVESKIISPQLDRNVIITGLKLSSASKDKSDNGRTRQRWIIRDADQLEIIGDNQNDADVVAWGCGEYDSSDNFVSPIPIESFCGKFFVALLTNVITNPDDVANKLFDETSRTKTDARWTSGDISIETDGYYYFIRRISRM